MYSFVFQGQFVALTFCNSWTDRHTYYYNVLIADDEEEDEKKALYLMITLLIRGDPDENLNWIYEEHQVQSV